MPHLTDRLRFRPAEDVSPEERESLRRHKPELLDYLQRQQEFRLPFPVGYSGLPEDQVVAARRPGSSPGFPTKAK
ncbi:hypothetical protein FIM12_03420 [SAR202 cluster bacterium AD-804-J14_MRT_500m]|nr:hypothetical protein [SAR202 cluster bacterium AD-804-J14_MRT_500m]